VAARWAAGRLRLVILVGVLEDQPQRHPTQMAKKGAASSRLTNSQVIFLFSLLIDVRAGANRQISSASPGDRPIEIGPEGDGHPFRVADLLPHSR
jgi:hypothetical protein